MDIKSKRITLIQKETYTFDLEYNDDFAILHLPKVDKFTKSVYGDMVICIEDIKEFLGTMGYANLYAGVDPTNKPIRKLAEKLGFSYLGNSQNIDVLGMEI